MPTGQTTGRQGVSESARCQPENQPSQPDANHRPHPNTDSERSIPQVGGVVYAVCEGVALRSVGVGPVPSTSALSAAFSSSPRLIACAYTFSPSAGSVCPTSSITTVGGAWPLTWPHVSQATRGSGCSMRHEWKRSAVVG